MELPDEWTVFPLLPIVSDERSPLRVGSDGKERRLCGCMDPTCANAGKHPAAGWGELPPGKKLVNKSDKRAGLGLATGARSGVIVLDLDYKEPCAKYPVGVNGLAALIAMGVDIPNTLMVKTGGGGFHAYFQWPGWKVKDSVSVIAAGVDIRGDGGYAVIPFTEHDTGVRYEFLNWGTPIAVMPDWLSSRLARSPGADNTAFPIPELPRIPGVDDTGTTEEGWKAIDRAVKEILAIPPGQRNERLFQKAAKLGDGIYLGYIREEDARYAIIKAISDAGWGDPEKTKATIERALKGSSKGRIVEVSINHRPANDRAIEIMAFDESVYVVGDSLAWDNGKGVASVTRPILEEILSANVQYRKKDKDGNLVPSGVPSWATTTIFDRGSWPGLRIIEGYSKVPILRPDMTIARDKGYDSVTRVILEESYPERMMTLSEASYILNDIVCDVPFASDSHKAAWLCSVLTPLAMYAFDGPMPLFMFDGSAAGAGKTQLATLSAMVGANMTPSPSTYSPDEAEMRKVVTTHAMNPCPVLFFDDVRGEFGGGTISRLVTSPDRHWKDRELGTNRSFSGRVNSVLYITLNQATIGQDLERRICPIRITPSVVRPERRSGFKHDPWLDVVAYNRTDLTEAALTLLRHGGNKKHDLTGWGSFTAWRNMVVGAVFNAGFGTPDAAVEEMREMSSTYLTEVESFAEAWLAACVALTPTDRTRGLTAKEAYNGCYPSGHGTFGMCTEGCQLLREWFESNMPKATTKAIGDKIRTFRDKPTKVGMFRCTGLTGGANRWRLV